MKEKNRVSALLEDAVYKDLMGFCNGSSVAVGIKCLLAIAEKFEEAPLGIRRKMPNPYRKTR